MKIGQYLAKLRASVVSCLLLTHGVHTQNWRHYTPWRYLNSALTWNLHSSLMSQICQPRFTWKNGR